MSNSVPKTHFWNNLQQEWVRVMVFNTIFSGGGHRNTLRKPQTCRKSLTTLSHNVVSSTPSHERDSNSQL